MNGSRHYVFDPGFGVDTIHSFMPSGANHDTLDLPASDVASIADVPRNTHQTAYGSEIVDPNSGDVIRLVSVSKHALVENRQTDFKIGEPHCVQGAFSRVGRRRLTPVRERIRAFYRTVSAEVGAGSGSAINVLSSTKRGKSKLSP